MVIQGGVGGRKGWRLTHIWLYAWYVCELKTFNLWIRKSCFSSSFVILKFVTNLTIVNESLPMKCNSIVFSSVTFAVYCCTMNHFILFELSTIMEEKNVLVYVKMSVFSTKKNKNNLNLLVFFPLKLGLPTADHGKLKNRAKFERKTAQCNLYVYYDLYGYTELWC